MCGIDNNNYLDGWAKEEKEKHIGAYAQAVRACYYSVPAKDAEEISETTCHAAVRAVAKAFTSAGKRDPTLDAEGEVCLHLRRQLRGYKKIDPGESPQQCIPFEILKEVMDSPSDSNFTIVVQQLLLLAFFFAMRSCEYLAVDKSYWGGKKKQRQTEPLRPRNFTFRKNHRIIPHDDPNLHLADSVTITFDAQKADRRNEPVTQCKTGDPRWCPVRAAAAVIRRMRRLVEIGLIKEEEYLSTPVYVYETSKGEKGLVDSTNALKILKQLIELTDYEGLGINPKEVGLHSMRSSAAMAMHMNRIPVYTIMLIGRWSSDAFLRYIRRQVEEFGSDVAKKMIQESLYHDVRLRDDLDPCNHNSNSFVANMGMGRNGTEINRNCFAVWCC